MNPRTLSSDVLVIGYGSLMSGFGLEPYGRLRVRGAARVALVNARRGFGKFSQHGDRYAMVLEPLDARLPIEVQTSPVDAAPTDLPEGLALLVQPRDLAQLADREGYSSGALQRVREEATRTHQELAAFLWSMFAQAEFDVARFRQQLFKLVGYTSPHYVPHPVRLDGHRCAITFLAPGREGTGSDRVVPVRVRTHNESLMTINDAWRGKPNRTQLTYIIACLLGGVHGIGITDLLRPLGEDTGLAERVRGSVAAEHTPEVARFLDMTGLDHTAYWQTFGPPTQTLRRSGLEAFLKG